MCVKVKEERPNVGGLAAFVLIVNLYTNSLIMLSHSITFFSELQETREKMIL